MKIAILTRKPETYSSKKLIEVGEQRKHEIIILDPSQCFVVMEEGKPSLHYSSGDPQKTFSEEELKQIHAIIPRIGVEITFYGAAVVRQFEMMGTFTTAPSQAITRSRDKLRSMQILSTSQVGMPKTAFASNPGDSEKVIEKVGGPPVVIKLLEGTQGIGVMLAETEKSAKSIIEAFYGVKVNILIQEFIQEANGCDIRALVVDNKVVAAMKRQGIEGEFRSNLHRGGKGIPIKLNQQEKDIAIKAARAMGLPIAGVDILQSSRGPLVIEVNSSPGLEGIEGVSKVDIASKIIEFIEKNIPKRKRKDKIGL